MDREAQADAEAYAEGVQPHKEFQVNETTQSVERSRSDEGVQVDEEAHADEQAEPNEESQAVKAAQAAEEFRADGTQVDGVSQRVQGSNSTEVRSSADLALRVVDGQEGLLLIPSLLLQFKLGRVHQY